MDSSQAEPRLIPDAGGAEALATVPAVRPRPISVPLLWMSALAAGSLAGVVAWGAGELTKDTFQPRLLKVQVLIQTFVQSTIDTEHEAAQKNAALAFAVFGFVTGLAMGLAGGVASRAPARGIAVGLGAGWLGAMLAGLSSFLILPVFYRRLAPDPNDFFFPIMVQGGIWIGVGAVAGIAFALGLGKVRSVPHAVAGGCVGALLGTVLFHFIAATAFQDSEYTEPLANSSVVRLIARALVAVFAAIGVARSVQTSLSPASGKPSSTPLKDL